MGTVNPEVVMGLDYGSKTVGVAVSDPLGITAQGVETIVRERENKLRKTLARLEEIAVSRNVKRIVLGFPKHLDNGEGERAEKTRLFAEKLEQRLALPVILWDERLSTASARRVLEESNIRRRDQKAFIDKIAAVHILQGFLDREAFERRDPGGDA